MVDELVIKVYLNSGEASTEFYETYEENKGMHLCGCIGAVYGEPYCACKMARLNLPLSKKHLQGIAAVQAAMSKIFDNFEE